MLLLRKLEGGLGVAFLPLGNVYLVLFCLDETDAAGFGNDTEACYTCLPERREMILVFAVQLACLTPGIFQEVLENFTSPTTIVKNINKSVKQE